MGRLITTAYANCREAVVAYPVNFPHVGENYNQCVRVLYRYIEAPKDFEYIAKFIPNKVSN